MNGLEPNKFSNLPTYLTHSAFGDDIIIHYGVPGDGTCFYYSLCAILNINNFLHQSLEEQVAIGRHYRCHFTDDVTWDDWLQFLKIKNIRGGTGIRSMKDLKQKMCSYKVWADEPVIRFIMYKLKLNLIFLDEKLNKLYCGVAEPDSSVTAVIYWVNKSHFEPLGRVNALDVDRDEVGLQFQFHADRDAEFINRLMNRYNSQCSMSD